MAQLVEHHLAKVRVASSNLVIRSILISRLLQAVVTGVSQACRFPLVGWK